MYDKVIQDSQNILKGAPFKHSATENSALLEDFISKVEKLDISKVRLYISAQNPITITSYDGFDPEIGGNVARRGLDVSRYPISSLYSLGVNIGF